MQIKQDPITKLWARSDGAILLPPTSKYSNFKKFRWTFGSKRNDGYREVRYQHKSHLVHCIICRSFHGLPPKGKPFCDHKSRVRDSNQSDNLHWVSRKENADNQAKVDTALEKYGARQCKDRKAYDAAKAAEKKARGLSYRKGSDGKQHWLPRVHKSEGI